MKKILTEERLCELAGIPMAEADTISLHDEKEKKRRAARHAAEAEFFGTPDDPLVTRGVEGESPVEDPYATQELDRVALQQHLEKEVPPENRRPEAMRLYRNLIEPHYTQDEMEILGDGDDEIADALGQLIGWFHPAFEDRRGRATFDNPSRLGVKVAQEFEAEGLDIVQDADEFMRRVEKYVFDETKAEFDKTIAHRETQPRHPDYDRAPTRMQTPGTPEHAEFQRLMQKAGDASGGAPTRTVGRIKK